MSRFYFRPLLDMSSHFLPFHRTYQPIWRIRYIQNPTKKYLENQKIKTDPHALFEQFYKQNQIKHQTQKQFFQKHFPKKIQPQYDPYKILQINRDANEEQIKDAYRKLAIRYHPKNNNSAESQQKFNEVAQAYTNIMQNLNKRQNQSKNKSFFQDFQAEVNQLFQSKRNNKTKEKENKKDLSNKSQQNSQNIKYTDSQLYSQSSHYQSSNGKQTKFVVQKIYKVNGKLIKVTRQEKLKEDGNLEITETIDNGKQTKKKTFIEEKKTHQIGY